MISISIKIPEKDCKGCPHLLRIVKGRNYYGEVSLTHQCAVFDTKIIDFQKCDACLMASKKADLDIDSLFQQINTMLTESYCNGIKDLSNSLKPRVNKPEVIDQFVNILERKAKE